MHAHGHGIQEAAGRIQIALGVTLAIFLLEVIGGAAANSLALLTDAGHVLTDLVALALSWFGLKQAERAATHRMTFGYHRVGILVALINALILVAVAALILFEAARRFREPEPVDSLLMLGVAVVGLAANGFNVWLLERQQAENLNVRSAFVHILGDTLSSAAVIGGGAFIYFTQQFWVDPALSLLIGVIIAVGSWGIIREGIGIFLEATPRHIDVASLVHSVMRVPGIQDVHDLHVWTVGPNLFALSAHVVVVDSPVSQAGQIIRSLNEMLERDYQIGHSAIQLESIVCDPSGLFCHLSSEGGAERHPHGEERAAG